MADKQFVVRELFRPMQVSAPDRFTGADYVEIRVTLTPLRWNELERKHDGIEQVGSQVHMARIESRDHRAVFHITRQMLRALFAEYLGIKDLF